MIGAWLASLSLLGLIQVRSCEDFGKLLIVVVLRIFEISFANLVIELLCIEI